MRYTKILLGFLFTACGVLQAMEVAPVASIKELLALSARGLQNELCGVDGMVNYEDVLAECHQHLERLKATIDEYRSHHELGHDVANVSGELHALFGLIQAKLGIIHCQIEQLPIVEKNDTIAGSRRRMLVAKLLKEIHEVQNSLHTLFNIMNDRDYRLLPGVSPAVGDRVVAKEVRSQLPVSLFKTLWQGAMGYFSPAAAEPIRQPQIMPEPQQSFASRIKDEVATALDNTYSQAIIDGAQTIAQKAVQVPEHPEQMTPQSVASIHEDIQKQMRWLSYDVAGRMRSYGFGNHNYMPMLADEFARKMGVKDTGMETLEMLGDGSIPLNRPWLLRLGISRAALFAARRFESLMVAAAQPKPESLLSKLKWYSARGYYGLIRLCAGKSNMKPLEEYMVGAVFNAPRTEGAVIAFDQRKKAPQMIVNEWGRELSVSVDGTENSTVVAIKKGSQKAFIELRNDAGDNLSLFDNAHGLRLNAVRNPDGSKHISIAGESHPLVRVTRTENGPEVAILGAVNRKLSICQQGSIASYIASVRRFRESPIQKLVCDELFYRVGAHAAFIRETSRRLHRTMQSLDRRELTNLEANVENTDMRGRLQSWATQWHRP